MVFHHAEAVQTHAEGEALPVAGNIANSFEYVGMHHAGPHYFQPVGFGKAHINFK